MIESCQAPGTGAPRPPLSILISCRDLSKRFGVRPLFEGLTFGLDEGERIGLIGPNGAGKSSLLKILAGLEAPDEGALARRRGLKVGYLSQQLGLEEADEGLPVREVLERALEGLGLPGHAARLRMTDALSLAGFGDPEQGVGTLSGGRRRRLAVLAQALREPDLLLLDEPTNHLDLDGVLWLERFLSGLKGSFLVVTHDRAFLERVANRVIELDASYPGGHFSCAGRYSDFLEQREALLDAQRSREESLRNTVRREIEWLRRGAKARATKQQARIDRAGELVEELGELEFRNSRDRAARIDFADGERRTRRLVDLLKAAKSMGGRRLFGPLDLSLGPGDKLGLIGDNGSGKSTLLKVLAGELPLDAGVRRRAEGLRVVTFDQHRDQLDLSMSLRKALCETGDHVYFKGRPVHVFSWADRFLFRKEQLEMPVGALSGGEQARVLIARLMTRAADLLLLDEPTNDLDIHTLEVLEGAMLDFPGALVLVTHDRYLLERVCGRLLALDGLGGSAFLPDLSCWEAWKERTSAASRLSPAEPASGAGLSRQENKELRNMERSIRRTEEEAEEALAALHEPEVAADAAELLKRQEALDAARRRVEALYERWQELESRR